ncbi:Uncharacterised protein [Mycobacteroides abscessus subsp. abscessus]|uniref:Uncharacterized protein n=1 Tax=Mycobacteroides abscessus subsp. abscessus TaxID=1185650 RepID=A0AB38D0M4_9MYCO|nr:hypothetical protein [Mycobacteroides abscessus]SHX06078.1 Uncharacterised protein [Mycobacteroides abscessus subsp. abscessus]SIA12400.1 Uncharacterised protein [Mycobacteroides abscessus subsp. abscessus]SIB14128.1 Uncharacterised protein [Mycobacteroides abscessus subsp. abscessus]SIB14629.1 Uncharacterised protein [Mycobacteroides abscessus subsp. abscessus]SIB18586.1 Uncharacterised protein [Mycobacteroides abscessus subsp. abscessus]
MTEAHEDHVHVADDNPMVPADSEDAPERWSRIPGRALKRRLAMGRGEYNPKRSRVRRRIHRIRRQKAWI